MTVPITLSKEEKSVLMYDLMQFAASQEEIWYHTGPQVTGMWIMKAIATDTQMETSNKGIFIRKLKKIDVDLWHRIAPFLENADTSCGTPKCRHRQAAHINGQCTGHTSRYVKPDNEHIWGRYVNSPCKCKTYRPKLL